MTQSEQQLENNLIGQLEDMGYEVVGGESAGIESLEKNIKTQLKKRFNAKDVCLKKVCTTIGQRLETMH